MKIDDNLPHHPKFIAVSPAAAWLWICGLAYCNRFLTDGQIPAGALRTVAPTIPRPTALVEQLVQARLWEKNDTGWHVHDYENYQSTRQEVNEKLTRMSQKNIVGGKARASSALRNRGRFISDVAGGAHQPTPAQIPSHPILKDLTTLSSSHSTLVPMNGNKELTDHARAILAFLNERTGRNFRPSPTNLAFITGRLKSGASVDDCRSIIARKSREWLPDPKMTKYLRPETLFNATKFESYLGELGS